MQGFTFNARQVAPNQMPATMPAGRYRFVIETSELKKTKAGDGGFVSLKLKSIDTTPGGLQHNLNIYNKSAQAVQIAYEQLSAICHAVGVLDVVAQENAPGMYLPMLHNIPFLADIKVEGEYNSVVKVYDANGNEPGATGGASQHQQPPAPVAPPAQQQPPQGAWGAPPQQQPQQPQPEQQPPAQQWQQPPAQQQPPQGAWGAPPQQQPQQPQQPQGAWGAPQQPQQGQPAAPQNGAPPGWAR